MFSTLNPKFKILAICLGVLIVVGIVFFLFSKKAAAPVSQPAEVGVVSHSVVPVDQTPTTITATSSEEITVKGVTVCLLYKKGVTPDKSAGCALGLKTSDNSFYALDTASGAYKDLVANVSVVIKGTFVPTEMISSNLGKMYDIKGIIQAPVTPKK